MSCPVCHADTIARCRLPVPRKAKRTMGHIRLYTCWETGQQRSDTGRRISKLPAEPDDNPQSCGLAVAPARRKATAISGQAPGAATK